MLDKYGVSRGAAKRKIPAQSPAGVVWVSGRCCPYKRSGGLNAALRKNSFRFPQTHRAKRRVQPANAQESKTSKWLAGKDRSELAAFIFKTQKQRKLTNRALCARAGVSASTLGKLRKGVRISDKSLFRLVEAAEQLRQETEPVAAVNARWLQKARELLSLVGSQNKLAKVLGVSRPYLGRVLSGEKSVTAKMIERLAAISI